jgi:uncharacterized repeat protein (TIGR03803 family)
VMKILLRYRLGEKALNLSASQKSCHLLRSPMLCIEFALLCALSLTGCSSSSASPMLSQSNTNAAKVLGASRFPYIVPPPTKAIFDAYRFGAKNLADDGIEPYGGLEDVGGNLYGTTHAGGIQENGTIFELARSGDHSIAGARYREHLLYAFAGNNLGDGQFPKGTLITDSSGVLYGTTVEGGGVGCDDKQDLGCGTIFALQPGAQTDLPLLHSFAGPPDGSKPQSGLVAYNGALYGMTQTGGQYDNGIVYSINPDGTNYTRIHTFQNSRTDGAGPIDAPLILNGILYGVAAVGGEAKLGVLFSLVPSPNAADTILHNFPSFVGDGATPVGTLVADEAGNLYGTTTYGGRYQRGMVFRINPLNRDYEDIYDFHGPPADGANPISGLTIDPTNGVLYGTTEYGGDGACPGKTSVGCGTVFSLTSAEPKYVEAFVASFQGSSVKKGGAYPHAGVVLGDDGNLYGTTAAGGSPNSICSEGCGTVFGYQLDPINGRPRLTTLR